MSELTREEFFKDCDTPECSIVRETEDKVEKVAGKWLGKQTGYPEKYDPDILTPFSRKDSLASCNIDPKAYIWYGLDIWNLWEVRYKLSNNASIQRIGQIIYPASSPYLIESKSMKLYFFSLANKKFEPTIKKSEKKLKEIIHKDISERVKSDVFVKLIRPELYTRVVKRNLSAIDPVTSFFTEQPSNLNPELYDIEFPESPRGQTNISFDDLLKVYESNFNTQGFIYYHGRSLCLITSQPDHCTEYIEIQGDVGVTPESLIQFLQSFENINRFHESTAHTIFDRLVKKCREIDPNCHVSVWSLYTRRGGIDINPFRTTDPVKYSKVLNHVMDTLWIKEWNQ